MLQMSVCSFLYLLPRAGTGEKEVSRNVKENLFEAYLKTRQAAQRSTHPITVLAFVLKEEGKKS